MVVSHGVVRHRIRRAVFIALASSSVLLAAWVTAGYFLFVVPAADHPQQADAVVVLAPVVETGRLEVAEKLMTDGYGELLVISTPDDAPVNKSSDICRTGRSYQVLCFSPDPVTTQGEARAIQRLSEELNWGSVTVVTNDFHTARARVIIQRCYSYRLNMIAVRSDLDFTDWVHQFVYQSAAWAKAAIAQEC